LRLLLSPSLSLSLLMLLARVVVRSALLLLPTDEHDVDCLSPDVAAGAIAVDLPGFPGGPRVFEVLARHCYDPSTPSNLEHWSAADVTLLLCGARLLDIADVIRLADDAIERDVLPYLPRVVDALAALEPVRSSLNAAAAAKATASPEKAATPSSPDAAADGHHSATSLSLSSSDGVRGMPPAMQTAVAAAVADVFGRCLNAAALRFSPLPTLHQLAPPLFAGVVRLTREYECPATVIQVCVAGRDALLAMGVVLAVAFAVVVLFFVLSLSMSPTSSLCIRLDDGVTVRLRQRSGA
jgi:hypothetical protein